jgi:hypothetical protein
VKTLTQKADKYLPFVFTLSVPIMCNNLRNILHGIKQEAELLLHISNLSLSNRKLKESEQKTPNKGQ